MTSLYLIAVTTFYFLKKKTDKSSSINILNINLISIIHSIAKNLIFFKYLQLIQYIILQKFFYKF